jgi:hypothetical protein
MGVESRGIPGRVVDDVSEPGLWTRSVAVAKKTQKKG